MGFLVTLGLKQMYQNYKTVLLIAPTLYLTGF